MTLSNFPARRIGKLAIAIGGATLIGIVSIILFFTVGGVCGAAKLLVAAPPGAMGAARCCLHGDRLPGRPWNTWRRG